MAVFLDASYIVALADPRDPWHAPAVALQKTVSRRMPAHTHALVVAEAVAIVGSAAGGKAARTVYDTLMDDTTCHFPNQAELDEAMRLVLKFDGGLSLADALSLVLMDTHDIPAIASFDRDFDGKGVQRLHKA